MKVVRFTSVMGTYQRMYSGIDRVIIDDSVARLPVIESITIGEDEMLHIHLHEGFVAEEELSGGSPPDVVLKREEA